MAQLDVMFGTSWQIGSSILVTGRYRFASSPGQHGPGSQSSSMDTDTGRHGRGGGLPSLGQNGLASSNICGGNTGK